MSINIYKVNPEFRDIMPKEIIDLEENATWAHKQEKPRGIKELPQTKELLEEHSLCAGCPEAATLRYVLSALPNPEDTIIVNSTGCTSLMFPHIALHTVHSLFGNQNSVASGIKRVLEWRFPETEKDVVEIGWTHFVEVEGTHPKEQLLLIKALAFNDIVKTLSEKYPDYSGDFEADIRKLLVKRWENLIAIKKEHIKQEIAEIKTMGLKPNYVKRVYEEYHGLIN
jgi:hypothetical protein